MKPKNFALRFLVTVIVGFLVWWFLRPMPKAPEKTASAPVVNKIETLKLVALPTIAPPVVPLVAKPAAAPTTSTTTPDAADPQADLKTAIPDIARLHRAGDTVALWQTYEPPEQWAEDGSQRIQQAQKVQDATSKDPQMFAFVKEANEASAQSFENLESLTPTYNDAGDEATFQHTLNLGGKEYPQITIFVKINGKWYIKEMK